MSEQIGRAPHYCPRDESPTFMEYRSWEKYTTGDYVRCSCGRVWYVDNGEFCRYREVKGRRLRRLIRDGIVAATGEDDHR